MHLLALPANDNAPPARAAEMRLPGFGTPLLVVGVLLLSIGSATLASCLVFDRPSGPTRVVRRCETVSDVIGDEGCARASLRRRPIADRPALGGSVRAPARTVSGA